MSISVWTNKNPLDAEWVGPNPSDKYEQIKDIKHLNPVEIEAMVLNHEQQIKDLAAHLLELKQSMFKPGMEDNVRYKERLIRIMGTFDLATGHADTFDELLTSLESELSDVLGHYREALKVKDE